MAAWRDGDWRRPVAVAIMLASGLDALGVVRRGIYCSQAVQLVPRQIGARLSPRWWFYAIWLCLVWVVRAYSAWLTASAATEFLVGEALSAPPSLVVAACGLLFNVVFNLWLFSAFPLVEASPPLGGRRGGATSIFALVARHSSSSTLAVLIVLSTILPALAITADASAYNVVLLLSSTLSQFLPYCVVALSTDAMSNYVVQRAADWRAQLSDASTVERVPSTTSPPRSLAPLSGGLLQGADADCDTAGAGGALALATGPGAASGPADAGASVETLRASYAALAADCDALGRMAGAHLGAGLLVVANSAIVFTLQVVILAFGLNGADELQARLDAAGRTSTLVLGVAMFVFAYLQCAALARAHEEATPECARAVACSRRLSPRDAAALIQLIEGSPIALRVLGVRAFRERAWRLITVLVLAFAPIVVQLLL